MPKKKLISLFFLLGFILLVFNRAHAQAPNVNQVTVSASSEEASHGSALAIDSDQETAWCAASSYNFKNIFRFAETDYPDWLQLEFSQPQTIAALYMRSGLASASQAALDHKIRNLLWVYQTAHSNQWVAIDQTKLYANRNQLVFRFNPIHNIQRLRLLILQRSSSEQEIAGYNNPCLREISWYSYKNAEIATEPWFMAVATWEEGNYYSPLVHNGYRAFNIDQGLRLALEEMRAPLKAGPDFLDAIWIKEMNQPWVLHEPRPQGFLLSGNYKDYDQVDPNVYKGFFSFVKNHTDYPMLSACGGHQLQAMATVYNSFKEFQSEFSKDHAQQVVVTCSNQPKYNCGKKSAKDCCYEGGAINPFKRMVQNFNDNAISNPFKHRRSDMLFNLLPNDPTGFDVYLYHSDYVNPERVFPFFDLLATYPKEAQQLSANNPSLIQAIKLKDKPVYGTQFHFDENQANQCNRQPGNRNMERILKNFAYIAHNLFTDSKSYTGYSNSNNDKLKQVFDQDRESMWCGQAKTKNEIILTFKELKNLRSFLLIQGTNPTTAGQQSVKFFYQSPLSAQSATAQAPQWLPLNVSKKSAYLAQNSCDPIKPGYEDGQSYFYYLQQPIKTSRIKISINSPTQAEPACLRELLAFE